MTLQLVNLKPEEQGPKLRDAWKELHSSVNSALVEAEQNGIRKINKLYALAMIVADEIVFDDLNEDGDMLHTKEKEIPSRLSFFLPLLAHIIVEQYGQVEEDGSRSILCGVDIDSPEVRAMREKMQKALGVC